MQDILGESLKRLYRKRVRKMRMVAILLVLSLLVSLDVFWTMRQPGLTLAGDADCNITEHNHDENCPENCESIEHTHTIRCYSDKNANIETTLDWQQMFAEFPYTKNLSKDLAGIAKTQVGYCESIYNFEVDKNGVQHGYTRYGAWYGTPYGEWSAIFVSFCLNYAGADVEEFPINIGAVSMAEQWDKLGKYAPIGLHNPTVGDLVFFKDNTVGIVAELTNSTAYVICGDKEDKVCGETISLTDSSISGWGLTSKLISDKKLYDISNGPAFFIFEGGTVTEKAQTFSLRNSRAVKDLLAYLEANEGSYFFTLLDKNNQELPKD